MKISELREKLAELEKLHGDVEVVYDCYNRENGTFQEPIDFVEFFKHMNLVVLA